MPLEKLQKMKTGKLLFYRFLLLIFFFVLSSIRGACQKANFSGDSYSTGVQSILKNIHAPAFKNNSWYITSYGAVADGKTNVKPVLDSIITVCSNSGGGKVVVPKGRYFVQGPLVLKSHVNLQFEEGAELIFSSNPKDYLPSVLTKWEGTELFNYSPFIYAYQCTDIAITGRGIVNGSASKSFALWRPQGSKQQDELRELGSKGTPVFERVFGERASFPPSMIQLWGCTNVLLEGISIIDAPYWVIHPVYCNNVIVRSVRINSLNLNNDGCDPESSTNVLIENCDFTVGDDAIAIKAGRDQDAWRIGRPTENVIVRHCTFRSRTNGLCIGSEMSAGVRNFYMENIIIVYCYSAIYFKSNPDRGGYIENIQIKNINCDSARSACIRFENNYHGGRGGHYPTLFKNFIIRNVHCRTSAEVGIYAVGIEGTPLRNILVKNIEIQHTPSVQILDNVIGLRYENVVINGKATQPVFTSERLKLKTD
jgi:polygalacturonase